MLGPETLEVLNSMEKEAKFVTGFQALGSRIAGFFGAKQTAARLAGTVKATRASELKSAAEAAREAKQNLGGSIDFIKKRNPPLKKGQRPPPPGNFNKQLKDATDIGEKNRKHLELVATNEKAQSALSKAKTRAESANARAKQTLDNIRGPDPIPPKPKPETPPKTKGDGTKGDGTTEEGGGFFNGVGNWVKEHPIPSAAIAGGVGIGGTALLMSGGRRRNPNEQ
jgi:hypothetical protein